PGGSHGRHRGRAAGAGRLRARAARADSSGARRHRRGPWQRRAARRQRRRLVLHRRGQPSMTAQNMPRAYVHRVSPEFFSTLRIPLLAGRAFTDTDAAQGSTAVIVSERVVKRFWPGQDPLGKRVKFGQAESNGPWLAIVGVVGEVKYRQLPENPTA